MQYTESALNKELSRYFFGHAQRRKMIAKLVVAVLHLCSVKLSHLCLQINPKVKVSSNFKRIQRFLLKYEFSTPSYVQWVFSKYGGNHKWTCLSLDRTNWKFGSRNINILTLGLCIEGTAIPLVWSLLPKEGNSSMEERINLLESFFACITEEQRKSIRYLVMDREFEGMDWLGYLKANDLDFVLRIRNNILVRHMGQMKSHRASRLFTSTKFSNLRKQRIISGHRLYIGGKKLKGKEYLILVSSKQFGYAQRIYAERWGIEVFFGSLKKRGFNLEGTHLTNLKRIKCLIFILAIAFVWSFKVGRDRHKNIEPIKLKKVGDRTVKLYSFFAYGLKTLRLKIIANLCLDYESKVLSCT